MPGVQAAHEIVGGERLAEARLRIPEKFARLFAAGDIGERHIHGFLLFVAQDVVSLLCILFLQVAVVLRREAVEEIARGSAVDAKPLRFRLALNAFAAREVVVEIVVGEILF